MKLYYAPGASSIGIHVLLEEIGQPFELHRLNLMEGEQRKPEFAAVNGKGPHQRNRGLLGTAEARHHRHLSPRQPEALGPIRDRVRVPLQPA